MIVDDLDVVRQGLAFCLRAFDDLQIVGEARTGSEAVRMCVDTQPDVILMDVFMPEMNGIEATRIIHDQFPDVAIIILSAMGRDSQLIVQARAAGAVECLDKYTPVTDLIHSIRVSRENTYGKLHQYTAKSG